MPFQRCTLEGGGQGWKWGTHGHCYPTRGQAEKQMQAIRASGYGGDGSMTTTHDDYSAEERRQMAKNGEAMPDGSYPIKTKGDLQNAIHAIGRGDASHASIKRHIIKRARALGAVSMLPEEWGVTDTHFELDEVVVLDAKDIRLTNDGYMVAAPRIARTGIQIYKGFEVGRPQMDTVKVYRPPDEVFHKDSMISFAHRPITDDHPPVAVTADNWRKYAVGSSGDEVARDGEFLRVPMVVMDAAVINKIKDGKVELSVGYMTDLKWGSGTDPQSGETYDAMQTNIRANHIAIVGAARGGDKLRIGDEPLTGARADQAASFADNVFFRLVDEAVKSVKHGERKMTDQTLKTVKVMDIDCQMTETAAALVTKALAAADARVAELTKQVTDLTTQVAKITDESKKQIETKDAELVTVKKQLEDAKLTPAKLDELVKDRQIVASKAKAVLADKLVVDGKTDDEIRRQVVEAKLGDACKGWTPEQIKASFDTLTADVKIDSSVIDTARALSQPGHHTNDAKNKSYAEYDKKIGDRWKGKAA